MAGETEDYTNIRYSNSGVPVVHALNAISASTTSVKTNTNMPRQTVTMQVNITSSVAPTAVSTQLQGSLDGINWYNLGSAVTATANGSSIVSSSGTVFNWFQVVNTITGGTSVVLDAYVGVAA